MKFRDVPMYLLDHQNQQAPECPLTAKHVSCGWGRPSLFVQVVGHTRERSHYVCLVEVHRQSLDGLAPYSSGGIPPVSRPRATVPRSRCVCIHETISVDHE